MPEISRYPREAWVPVVAGFYWLWNAPDHGFLGFLVSTLPGCLLLGAGVSMLLYPGDRRIAQFAALGGVLGVLLALPAFVAIGWLHALLLIAASGAAFVAAGAHSVRNEPATDGVPPPEPSLALSAQVALDEAMLSTMQVTVLFPRPSDHARIEREVAEAREMFAAAGWLEEPAKYHEVPPLLESPTLAPGRVLRTRYEHLSFESGYEPRPGEPGRERWLSRRANRTARAWVVRHADGPRPWLVCIHGYQMGVPLVDLAAFPPPWLHRRLGLNLLLPVLPLHGKRKSGRRSGDGFVTGDFLDTIHAEAQAMWDIRRLLGWARAEGATRVGVMGFSLGGYNAALLASLEPDLACAIAGIPAVDLLRLMARHAPPLRLREFEERGPAEASVSELLRVVSPLGLEPRIPRERRFLFAGVADRLVPPDQVRDLWHHWERPRIAWYQGAHITFRAHRSVVHLIGDALRESELVV